MKGGIKRKPRNNNNNNNAGGGGGGGLRNSNNNNNNNNNAQAATAWKVVSALLLFVIVLFATDSIEIKLNQGMIEEKQVHLRTENNDNNNNNDNSSGTLTKNESNAKQNNNNDAVKNTNDNNNNDDKDNKITPTNTKQDHHDAHNDKDQNDTNNNSNDSSSSTSDTDDTSDTAAADDTQDETNNDKDLEDTRDEDNADDKDDTNDDTDDDTDDDTKDTPSNTDNNGNDNDNQKDEMDQKEDNPSPADPSTSSAVDSPTKSNDSNNDNMIWYTYTTRARELETSETESLIQKWGSWTLVDDNKDRPTNDFYSDYPNRDVPSDKFPSNAWQKDTEYLQQFLTQGKDMVMRAMEAILAEYGHGTDDSSEPFEKRSEMFQIKMIDIKGGEIPPARTKLRDDGGWTTPDSWEALKRHLLHAIMSQDSFIFAMGGHSAAAGHGNHFQQSYTLQVQKILEPLFARLGVFHESRNFGNGGMGTAHNGIASASIFGPDVNMLMWDSGMTEKGADLPDMMARQAILGGERVPVLWSFPEGVLKHLNENADIPVGARGTSMKGIPTANTYQDLENIAWAARYMICDNEIQKEFCKPNEYNGTCWIERPDYTPTHKQDNVPGGRASWHPGNRYHQLIGRTLTFTILLALHEALVMWSEIDGYLLPDDAWHVTDFYKDMRTKASSLTTGACTQLDKYGLKAVCNIPFQARTFFTPRGHAPLTSIRNIMPKEMLDAVPPTSRNVYDAPDVFIPQIHPVPGEVDVTGILELGVPFQPVRKPTWDHFYRSTTDTASILAEGISPGKGIVQAGRGADDLCDGTYNSFCDRNESNECLLRAHNDGRNGIISDGYSGWVILNVPDVSYGLIAVKYHTWSSPSRATESWKSINNEGKEGIVAAKTGKNIKGFGRDYCGDFKFEFMVDGKLTTWDADTMENKKKQHVQRVVEVFLLLDDRDYTNGGTQDVEIAYRVIGCGRQKALSLTHIYWA